MRFMSFWHIELKTTPRLALATAGAFFALSFGVKSDGFDTLPQADIYLLGEVHDMQQHHRNQAQATALVAPKALVFEMLSPAQAEAGRLVDWSDRDALDLALGWSASGWGSFDARYGIFQAAPEARLYGAALPIEDVRRAISEGAASVFGDEAARYGLSRPLPAAQQAQREALQNAAHCGAMPEAMLPGMVEAQRLRDAAFARTAVQAFDQTGGPVVVITGNGHVRDWAMPAALAAAAPDLQVLSIAQGSGEDPGIYDLWIQTPDAPRIGDPCDAFD